MWNYDLRTWEMQSHEFSWPLRSQLNFLSLRDATTFNYVYIRKSDTRLEAATSSNDLDRGYFTSAAKPELIRTTRRFSKRFCFFFFSHTYTNFALAPLVKTTLRNLKVFPPRVKTCGRKIGSFTLITVAWFFSSVSAFFHRGWSCFMDALSALAPLNIYSRLFI